MVSPEEIERHVPGLLKSEWEWGREVWHGEGRPGDGGIARHAVSSFPKKELSRDPAFYLREMFLFDDLSTLCRLAEEMMGRRTSISQLLKVDVSDDERMPRFRHHEQDFVDRVYAAAFRSYTHHPLYKERYAELLDSNFLTILLGDGNTRERSSYRMLIDTQIEPVLVEALRLRCNDRLLEVMRCL